MITKQKVPKLCIPLSVCQIVFPSSNFDQTGISTMAKRISKMRLTATAARDLNKCKNYDLWSQGTVLLLPQEIHEENDDKIVIRSDETTEERDVLNFRLIILRW